MSPICECNQGIPVITKETSNGKNPFCATHHCSHCSAPMFDVELSPGVQLIATRDITSDNGEHVVPKGRLVRISAFVELSSSCTGLIFAGLLGVGGFPLAGFAAVWDIRRILID